MSCFVAAIVCLLTIHLASSQEVDGGWARVARERPWRLEISPEVANQYGTSIGAQPKTPKTKLEWKPVNSSSVLPALDPAGFCTTLHRLARVNTNKHGGGMLLIGDESSARATMMAASAVGVHHTSYTCSSSKSCVQSVCDPFLSSKLSYMSMKKFLRDACINVDSEAINCDAVVFAKTLIEYDVMAFGLSPLMAKMHANGPVLDLQTEISAISEWFNTIYTPILRKDDTKLSSLFIYQSAWPSEQYCRKDGGAVSDQDSMHKFEALQTLDRKLWTALSTGEMGRYPAISMHRVDISGAVAAREKLHHEESPATCELSTTSSDSLELLLNSVYSILLDHVTPTSFPRITNVHAGEDFDKAIQRIAMNEMAVINYLQAVHKIAAARQHGWYMPEQTAVTLTLTDIRYHEAFSYWYYSRRQFGVEGVMIAMDPETCAHLETKYKGYLYFCMVAPRTLSLAPPHKQTTLVGLGKVLYPALFMSEFNMKVIFSEMDIFWRGNPYPFLTQADRKGYDIQVSAHVGFNAKKQVFTLPKELNIGFFYLNPTPAAKLLFADLLHFLVLFPFHMLDKVTADQKVFDRFIRNIPPGKGEEVPVWDELFVSWRDIRPDAHFADFHWARLPGDVFTHNDVDELAIVPQTLAYHISWGVDPPSRRVYCAYKLGLLPSNYTPTTEFENKVCFKYLYQ